MAENQEIVRKKLKLAIASVEGAEKYGVKWMMVTPQVDVNGKPIYNVRGNEKPQDDFEIDAQPGEEQFFEIESSYPALVGVLVAACKNGVWSLGREYSIRINEDGKIEYPTPTPAKVYLVEEKNI